MTGSRATAADERRGPKVVHAATMILPLLRTAVCATAAVAAGAQSAAIRVASTPWSNYTVVQSRSWTAPVEDVEAADDFDFTGTVTRVVFHGNGCFNCQAPTVRSASVRFYAWANGSPGALEHEVSLPAGSPALRYHAANPGTVEVDLPAPFAASGRHFVSMQLHFQGAGHWGAWAGSTYNQLTWAKVRNRATNGPWVTPPVNSAISTPLMTDLTFDLWGHPPGHHGPTPIPCQSWNELPAEMPAGADFAVLRDLKVLAHDDAWAVGDRTMPPLGSGSRTLAMHWNGTTWTTVPTPDPGRQNTLLWAIDGVAGNDVWAAGTWTTQTNGGWTGQQVFAMHWDGGSWTPAANLPLPNNSIGAGVTGARVLDVEAIASDDVWFVGTWFDVVSAASGQITRPGLLMHWDGTDLDLSVVPIVTGVANQYFEAVAASSGSDVWAVGGAGTAGGNPSSVPVVFHFDGANWSHTPCAVPNLPGWWVQFYDVEVVAPGDVYVFGFSRTYAPTPVRPFVSHWDGTGWTLLPGPPNVGRAAVVSATEMYAVGNPVYRFDGAAWLPTETFPTVPGGVLGAVDALGPCEVYGVGGQERIGQRQPFAARLDHPSLWRATARVPSLPQRAPATQTAATPPRLGQPLHIVVADPAQALGVPLANHFWVMSTAPAAGWPLPAPLPFGGAAGGPGELFVDLAQVGYIALLPVTATPAVHRVHLPANASLAGLTIHTQALLGDPTRPDRVVVTNGLDLLLGW
jgi:hypothetical protein